MPHHWTPSFSARIFIRNLGWLTAFVLSGVHAAADDSPTNETWSLHGQSTVVEQWHGGLHSPYSGLASLSAGAEDKHTATLTGFLGRQLWPGGELYYNPEVTLGTGLSGTVGVAGFPNGEATRAGSTNPTYNTARLFFRQTINLGGEIETMESDKNQIAGKHQIERLTLTLGKLSAADIFDGNAYSHDPRTQFLNWALMDNGAWDYPADAKGYTGGFVAELNEKSRIFRWGTFMEPSEANGRRLDPHLRNALAQVAEWEERYSASGRAGAWRVLTFWNRAHMGNYADAVATTFGHEPDITLSRQYRSKIGAGLEWEQALTAGIGAFARTGYNDGRTETWAFTEIDRTLSAGLSLKGTQWGRAEDTVGLAGIVNGLSRDHRRYLASGGYGFIVGDGALRYGTEQIIETYYDWKAMKALSVAADWQLVANPGYNRDRGPASVWAVRAHADF